MEEYKKITKEDVNLPKFCLFFIEHLKHEIDDTDFDEYEELEVTIDTTEFPYCYEAFNLIVKTFSRMGFYVRIPTFITSRDNGVKTWTYKWIISKGPDDLPF